MAEAIVSLLLDRFDEVLVKQAKNEMNLVEGAHSQIHNIIYQLKRIRPDLNDAEDRRQNNDEAVKEWLDEVEDTLYEMEDMVDDWNTVILLKRIQEDTYSGNTSKLWRAPISLRKCIVLRKRRFKIEGKVKKMNKRLDAFAKMKQQFDFVLAESEPFRILEQSFVAQTLSADHSAVVGQEESMKDLLRMLLEKEESRDNMKVISIVGMGGIGKTTLAQLLYNHSLVVNHFDARAWVCVGQRYSNTGILRAILRSLNIDSSSLYKYESLYSLHELIRSSVSQKRFLLVLDNLWHMDVWDGSIRNLLYGASECLVLVTTRIESVAMHIGSKYIHLVNLLSTNESRLLIHSIALSAKAETRIFEGIGHAIVQEAKGLPLSIKCIGGMLRPKQLVKEWESVLDKLHNLNTETLDGFFTLCYQDLPTALKRCFCYCLIFPDNATEINADKIVRMWLAHGYLGSTGNDDRVEERGHEYVTELANRSFFQALDRDDNGRIKSFSIHDLLRDLAAHYYHLQFRTETINYRNNRRTDFFSQLTCRHLTILSSTEAPSSPPRSSANDRIARLRTFFAPEMDQETLQTDFFPQLSYLRVLSFCDGNLSSLPKEIGKLIYLRYLDLSGNPLDELPEFICKLCNLETLDLQDCILLNKLPSGIGKLIMLRHLVTRNTPRLQCFPEGLEKLTMLRTLGKFMVGKEFNKLKYLKNLNNLEGTLELEFFEVNDEDEVSDAEDDVNDVEDDVSDAEDDVNDVEDVLNDAELASLKDKRYLRELKLTFRAEVGTEVFEALEAPPNLQRMYIYGLRDKSWSNWISAPQNHLKELKIKFCTKCLSLPPLWRLPLLEILDIDAMMAIRSVSLPEFLGIRRSIDRETIVRLQSGTVVAPLGTTDNIEVAVEGSSCTNRCTEIAQSDTEESTEVAHSDTKVAISSTDIVSSSPSRRDAFPMLKKLRFNFCIEWDNWEDITEHDEIEDNVSILPSLLELEVSRCEMLTSLPHKLLRRITTLQRLKIGYCSILSELYKDDEQRARLPMSITTIVPTLEQGES